MAKAVPGKGITTRWGVKCHGESFTVTGQNQTNRAPGRTDGQKQGRKQVVEKGSWLVVARKGKDHGKPAPALTHWGRKIYVTNGCSRNGQPSLQTKETGDPGKKKRGLRIHGPQTKSG